MTTVINSRKDHKRLNTDRQKSKRTWNRHSNKIYALMFIAALFQTEKRGKNPFICSSTEERKDVLWTYNGTLPSHKKEGNSGTRMTQHG
jgi:hypothetical protein